ncbi:replication protein P [Klebsiella aerogenes]|uniref:replication protein P n=1 Tax=Klebsiella aerogenes TaxID=548 RepID=UPI001C23911A|nr:replication protein P [Klebsiella aerogenes]QXA73929.1 DNA replication protein [Klebsiella aerogenes]HCI6019561.1 DNA replication protein [Klebsiella quasipneumoniae subsp. quasipneumoniae]
MSTELIQAIANRDAGALSRIAGKAPDRRPAGGVLSGEVERLVDALFRQLRQVFPAASATNLRTPQDEAAAKQQWIAAFAENGITNKHQLSAGMKHARASLSPFWPSPGQFIGWCKEGELQAAGLPSAEQLAGMVRDYCARRGLYDDPTEYPWEAPAHYWMVTSLYSGMRYGNWTPGELLTHAKAELAKMVKRIAAGEAIPEPVQLIEKPKHTPVSQERGREIIAEIRRKMKRPVRKD